MSSPAPPRGAGAPASQPIFPDEILGEIFLRLDAPADLARASAACTAFLRVVRFLRRNRSLYGSPVVGFLEAEAPSSSLHPRSLHHAEPPHLSTPAGRALAGAVDLTLSFLPDPSSWRIRDASHGRLLLCSRTTADFLDLVVCDPVHRRYVRIPQIPDDLTTGISIGGRFHFLAPGSEEESSFRVAWMVKLEAKVTAFIFSSVTGKWHRLTFDGWRANGDFMFTSCRYYTHRSLYKTSVLFRDVLMLDTRQMEFSVVRIPRVNMVRMQAIVEVGEGRLGLLNLGDGTLDLYCKAWEDNHDGAEEWQHEKAIPLPDTKNHRYYFIGAGSGYLLLQAIPRDRLEIVYSSHDLKDIQYFTLEVKTLLLERLCLSNKRIIFAHLYANFSLLSVPTV